MRKKIILLIVVLLLITSCNSESVIEEPINPSEINTFNETIENDYVIIDGSKYAIEETMKEKFYYLEDSEQLEKKTYETDAKGISFDYMERYIYEDDVVVEEIFSDLKGKKISETYYTYDHQQRVIQSRAVLQAGDNEIIKEYSYGENTKTLLQYLPDGEFLRKVITYYDEDNRTIKTESYNQADNITSLTEKKYENEYVMRDVTKENNKITAKRYEEKNNMGDVIKFASIIYLDENDPSTMFYLVDNTYDDNMRLVEKTQYKVMNQIDAEILENNYFK
jgi:hypothetical protein